VAVTTDKKIDLVFRTQVFKLKRVPLTRVRYAATSATLRQNTMAEVKDETPADSSSDICPRPAAEGTIAAGDQNHS
jgi:hypothetical protein